MEANNIKKSEIKLKLFPYSGAEYFFLLFLRPGNLLLPSEPCYYFSCKLRNRLFFRNANMHMALKSRN